MNISSYIQQSKSLSKNDSMKGAKAAFLSNFTIQGLSETVRCLSYNHNVFVETYLAPYDQYGQQILDDSSSLYSFNPDIIFLILDSKKLFGNFLESPYSLDSDSRRKFADEKCNEIIDLIEILKTKLDSKIVMNSLLAPFYSSRGIVESKQDFGIDELFVELNNNLITFSRTDTQFFVFDFQKFAIKQGYDRLVDQKLFYLADMCISPSSLIDLAEEYLGYIFPLVSLTKKCIVLDLDNTLWGGIIGEDGINNIKLGLDTAGRPFFDFQKCLLELFDRGVILAINSKNNYEDAIEVIRNHKYMILREDNFASIMANWNDKASNMEQIAKDLNIGTDSFVFIDDDKTNRELIRQMNPEILVVDLPRDTSQYVNVLQKLKVFNQFSITEDDYKRGKSYVSQKKRKNFESSSKDLSSFLKNLEIKIFVKHSDSLNISRISQLTQKTNQFNLTTKRYLDEDIINFIDSKSHLVSTISVLDKFGDYGLTGAAIIEIREGKNLWIVDTFLLSCRVLGKNVEFAFMETLFELAQKNGIKNIKANFNATKKNKPASNFLSDFGFIEVQNEDSRRIFNLEVDKQEKRDNYVEVTVENG